MSITATQSNVNVPNFSAMSREDLATLAALQFEKLQRLYSIIAMPNKVYSPAEKLVLLVAPDVLAKEKPNERGLKRIDMGKVAEHVGLSADAASRNVKNICERSNATRAVEPYTQKNGQKVNLVYVNDVEPAWSAPTTIEVEPEKLRNLPGDERRICSCGAPMKKQTRVLRTQEIWVCKCGECKVYHAETIAEPWDVTENIEGPQHADLILESPTIEQEPENSEEFQGPQHADLSEEPEILTALYGLHSGGSDAFRELQALPIWTQWRAEPDEKGKLKKVPYIPDYRKILHKASPTNPKTWGTHSKAQEAFNRSQVWIDKEKRYTGIGFMCNGMYTVIDLDHCIVDGVISDYAKAILARFNSYTEVSYSGTGLHIIVRGSIPSGRKLPQIELYCEKRFMVWTGQHLASSHSTIEDYQSELDALYAELAPPAKETPQTSPIPHCVSETLPLLSSEQVLLKARNGANGERFRALYDDGNTAGYPSQSEAELALCNELAYRSGNNVDLIDSLFRQSALFRAEKWDSPARAGETYGSGTIERALIRKQVAS